MNDELRARAVLYPSVGRDVMAVPQTNLDKRARAAGESGRAQTTNERGS